MESIRNVLPALLAFMLSLPLQGDAIFALGYSVNNGSRPLLKINPENGEIVATVPTDFRPVPPGSDAAEFGMAFGDGALWILGTSLNNGPRTLHRVDPATGHSTGVATELSPVLLKPDFSPRTLAFGDGSVWGIGESINNGPRPLLKLDPATGKIVQTIPTDLRPAGFGASLADVGLAHGGGFLWGFGQITNNSPRPLFKIEPASGRIEQALPTAFRSPPVEDLAALGLAFGAGHIWVFGPSINNGPRRLHKIDPNAGATVSSVTTQLRPPGFGTDLIAVGFAYAEGK